MLEVEARYARERYQLYRAKSYGPRPTSPARLRELERAWKLAESRLQRHQAVEAAGLSAGGGQLPRPGDHRRE
jgi:hypothetical protein